MNEKALDQSAASNSVNDRAARNDRSAAFDRPASNRRHSLIVSNAAIAIGSRIHGHRSEIYVSSMRVRLPNKAVTLPDVVVVSNEPKFTNSEQDLLENPTVIVEIFSNGTNSSDRTQKLESFLGMESIKECLLVKEDEMRIEHYARQNAKQWIYRIYNERDDVVSMESINCKVSLQEIYAQIKFGHTQLSSTAVN